MDHLVFFNGAGNPSIHRLLFMQYHTIMHWKVSFGTWITIPFNILQDSYHIIPYDIIPYHTIFWLRHILFFGIPRKICSGCCDLLSPIRGSLYGMLIILIYPKLHILRWFSLVLFLCFPGHLHGGFHKLGIPKKRCFIKEHPFKVDDFGVSPFQETSI